ncbi:MAG TPA: adenylosuccinate lyase, partial [Bacillota bacterium]|nr:adenylosuccinate lyase [Bacillota bacterium]
MIDRYARPEMKRLWSLENRFAKFLQIEILAARAWAELGVIPREAARLIEQNSRFSVERILELEQETRHDVVAFTRCVAESLGDESRYFHYGLTSYDVVDTALSAMLVEAAALIKEGLHRLEEALKEQALRHKQTVMAGRTHGVHAEPTSLGLKFALWLAETRRNRERLERATENIRVGKLSGAVGHYAHIDPFVEEYVCRELGLAVAPVSTQVLQRDRHAEFVTVLALVGASLEKIALEVRNLQRTETRELEEPFYRGQKGSSAMPHKRNPVTCEQICGLARVLRGYASAALENVALWHERDISHSSVERIILPDSTTLVDYLLHQVARVIRELHIYPEQMTRNLGLTGGLIYSQRVLLALVDKGLSREKSYDLVQRCAMESWTKGLSFKDLLWQEPAVREQFSERELDGLFDPAYYLRRVDLIYRRLGLGEEAQAE